MIKGLIAAMALSGEFEHYDRKLKEYEELIHSLRQDLDQLTRSASRDPRTDLYSTSFFYTRLKEEVVRSDRYRHFLTLILVHVEPESIDSTEQVDREIKRFSEIIFNVINRRTDLLAHFGRRQIAIILPETDRVGAETVVSRYRAMADSPQNFRYGIVSFPEDASSLKSLLSRLDALSQDLYRGAARHLKEQAAIRRTSV